MPTLSESEIQQHISHLSSANSDVRVNSVRVLLHSMRPEKNRSTVSISGSTILNLVTLLSNENPDTRVCAANVLINIPKGNPEAYCDREAYIIVPPRWLITCSVMRQLISFLSNEENLDGRINALDVLNSWLKYEAILSIFLSYIDISKLIPLLSDEKLDIQEGAASVLEQYVNYYGYFHTPCLDTIGSIEKLFAPLLSNISPNSRHDAFYVLSYITRNTPLDSLCFVRFITEIVSLLSDDSSCTQRTAVRVLFCSIISVKDGDPLRSVIANTGAISKLVPLLLDVYGNYIAASLYALGSLISEMQAHDKMTAVSIIPKLVLLLSNKDITIRNFTVYTMRELTRNKEIAKEVAIAAVDVIPKLVSLLSNLNANRSYNEHERASFVCFMYVLVESNPNSHAIIEAEMIRSHNMESIKPLLQYIDNKSGKKDWFESLINTCERKIEEQKSTEAVPLLLSSANTEKTPAISHPTSSPPASSSASGAEVMSTAALTPPGFDNLVVLQQAFAARPEVALATLEQELQSAAEKLILAEEKMALAEQQMQAVKRGIVTNASPFSKEEVSALRAQVTDYQHKEALLIERKQIRLDAERETYYQAIQTHFSALMVASLSIGSGYTNVNNSMPAIVVGWICTAIAAVFPPAAAVTSPVSGAVKFLDVKSREAFVAKIRVFNTTVTDAEILGEQIARLLVRAHFHAGKSMSPKQAEKDAEALINVLVSANPCIPRDEKTAKLLAERILGNASVCDFTPIESSIKSSTAQVNVSRLTISTTAVPEAKLSEHTATLSVLTSAVAETKAGVVKMKADQQRVENNLAVVTQKMDVTERVLPGMAQTLGVLQVKAEQAASQDAHQKTDEQVCQLTNENKTLCEDIKQLKSTLDKLQGIVDSKATQSELERMRSQMNSLAGSMPGDADSIGAGNQKLCIKQTGYVPPAVQNKANYIWQFFGYAESELGLNQREALFDGSPLPVTSIEQEVSRIYQTLVHMQMNFSQKITVLEENLTDVVHQDELTLVKKEQTQRHQTLAVHTDFQRRDQIRKYYDLQQIIEKLKPLLEVSEKFELADQHLTATQESMRQLSQNNFETQSLIHAMQTKLEKAEEKLRQAEKLVTEQAERTETARQAEEIRKTEADIKATQLRREKEKQEAATKAEAKKQQQVIHQQKTAIGTKHAELKDWIDQSLHQATEGYRNHVNSTLVYTSHQSHAVCEKLENIADDRDVFKQLTELCNHLKSSRSSMREHSLDTYLIKALSETAKARAHVTKKMDNSNGICLTDEEKKTVSIPRHVRFTTFGTHALSALTTYSYERPRLIKILQEIKKEVGAELDTLSTLSESVRNDGWKL